MNDFRFSSDLGVLQKGQMNAMRELREQARAGMARKLASYGAKSTGASSGGLGDRPTQISSAQNRNREDSGDAKAVRLAKNGGSVKRLDRKPRKKGGRVWEGLPKAATEDKKPAKRRGEQKSTEELKRGGRAKRADGGSIPPRALSMTLSPTQGASTDADFGPALASADQRASAAIDRVWRNFAGPNAGPPTDEDKSNIFRDLGRAAPTNVVAGVSALRELGVGQVVDPEGRVGNPVFVAGTSPTGANVPLDHGSIARLADTLAYLHPIERPGAPWGGNAYNFRTPPPPGYGDTSIVLNTAPNSLGTPPADVLAHETGHTIHNYMGRAEAPLAGANSAALGEFANMSTLRGEDVARKTGARGSLEDYRYFNSAREQFAEGVRQYLTDPNGFKSKYPEASRFLRGVVNSDPEMRRLLMLSQRGRGTGYG